MSECNERISNGESRKSLRKIAIFGIYALLVLAWVYAIPGWVAYKSHVMSDADISDHLPIDARAAWAKYQNDKVSYRLCSDLASSQIASAGNMSDDLGNLVKRQETCSAALRGLKPPVVLAPYSGNWLSEIWVIAYVGLGVLLLTNSSGNVKSISIGRTVLVLAGLYAAFNWDNYIRNFVLNGISQGRLVFSFVNWDISRASFVLQELRSMAMMTLVALLWELYFHSADCVDDGIEAAVGSDNAELVQQVLLYRKTLLRWQTDSVLLAVVFVPFDYFFWQEIETLHDLRYFPSAMAIQLIWLTTWYLASRPLLRVSNWWQLQRLSALTKEGVDRDAAQLIISTADSTTEWQLLGAAITAGASLVVPLVRALLHR